MAATPEIPTQPKLATVLFDEAHSEAWTIDPERAARMQPAHPEDSSLARAAGALAQREFRVESATDAPLSPDRLSEMDVLVIPHPSDPKWEATTGQGTPRFSPEELDAIERFVATGGGLIVLGETEQDKYGNNLNELLSRFGVRIENATVQDYSHHHREAPSWVLAELEPAAAGLLARVGAACFYRAGTLALHNGGTVIARSSATAAPARAPLAAAVEHGAGRVAVLADSDLFGDDCLSELDHEALWLNLVYWVAEPRFRRARADFHPSPAAEDPNWIALRDAVAELRLTQRPDGSIDTAEHDPAALRPLTERIAESAQALAPRFPHQTPYIEALREDLTAWADAGFPRPDFIRSLEAFRPEQHRRDGIEHLVVFPMYKQNASRDSCFEALIVRVPWPDWLDRLERDRYDNPKFVPVNLVDHTAGYDSECATLFPETFSTAERPPSYFGAIFCDREAERLRRVAGRAAELLELNLPPDAACLLESPQLSTDAYLLWDMVHDRTHMRGDLPFDPFMIRQRSPYWMYSLEELRCDLTTFAEMAKLESEGFAFARHVQHAILFDRLFRFPVTGSRVRNYDGLGGQLLFAFLHRHRYLHWTDNRLTIDWNRIADGVEDLRLRVHDLYHAGIDRSKLAQWIAAHDLVSEYVPPAESSVWAADRRQLPEVEEPKQLVDLSGDRVDARGVDLLDAEAAGRWASHLNERFGKVDGLLHLVGGWRGGDPIESFDLADYEFLHDLLVRTVQLASRAFHSALTAGDHGRFVLVSSSAAQRPEGTNAAYAAAKAAAEAWTLALADSFKDTHATANVIVVNAILTAAMREANPEKQFPTFTPAEDLADAIAFVCSDAAAKMNGQRLSLHP